MFIPFTTLIVVFAIACVMMIAGLFISARTSFASQMRVSSRLPGQMITVINDQQIGSALGSRRSQWLILIISLGLLFLALLSYLYAVVAPTYSLSIPLLSSPHKFASSSFHLLQGTTDAAKALKRLAQLDPSQYSSEQEFRLWSGSACSTAAITESINAYGYNYRISDILSIEMSQSVISPTLGLLKLSGIEQTVAQLGFSTAQLSHAPLDSLLGVAKSGWPIIVNFPPGRDWPSGHFLVVTGGNRSSVFLADSSIYNITVVSRQRFLQDWGGFAVVVMPNDYSVR